MDELWQKRRQAYHKRLLKYLRYVLNDHFVLALLFICGAVAYNYNNFLKTYALSQGLGWTRIIIALILGLALSFGRLATFLEPADLVFLAPKESDLKHYLKKSFVYTSLVCLCEQAVFYLLLCPYLKIILNFSLGQLICLGLSQLLLKELGLYWDYLRGFAPLKQVGFMKLASLILVVLASYFPLGGLILSGGFWLGCLYGLKVNQQVVAWKFLIEKEAARMQGLYRFFNLFTDVNLVTTSAKRRKYLDWLLPTRPAYTFLYLRGFMRTSEYLGIYLRLTVLGSLLLIFIKNYYLACGVAGLFLYLIGLQLFSLSDRYQEIVFVYLYPLSDKQQLREFSGVLLRLLVPVCIIFSTLVLVTGQNVYLFSCLLLGLVLESYLITKPYFVWRQGRVRKN